ncbi:uncharacterized protein LOC120291858 [Eucalyptus grandis]|uniref:uncharacterized protein LOC120291858 n=1 Tax=Eucalyptus grandis TaxID=71139 RepID=UPI00192EB29D|nr:uncharacterized protein LOC120291858 [Eucalyptus grandis]
MATKLEVFSTDTIKPSSPTPPHLRNFNCCLLDQLSPPFYVPIVLFYSDPGQKAAPNSASVTGNLKTSIAQALSLFYPLGGRVKGNADVDCYDEDALYLEATKIEVVSTDTIKPSSPTPPHLRNFKFCLLDQLSPPFYVPIVLFYSDPDQKAAPNSASVTGNLKTSIAQALSLFYPLGGRVKGNADVDCYDDDALYLEEKARFELQHAPLATVGPYVYRKDMRTALAAKLAAGVTSCYISDFIGQRYMDVAMLSRICRIVIYLGLSH